jgi:hypothetical protein
MAIAKAHRAGEHHQFFFLGKITVPRPEDSPSFVEIKSDNVAQAIVRIARKEKFWKRLVTPAYSEPLARRAWVTQNQLERKSNEHG